MHIKNFDRSLLFKTISRNLKIIPVFFQLNHISKYFQIMEIDFYHHKLLVGLVQYFFKSSSFSTVLTNITDHYGLRKLSVAVPSENSDVAESNDVYWTLHVFLCNKWPIFSSLLLILLRNDHVQRYHFLQKCQ